MALGQVEAMALGQAEVVTDAVLVLAVLMPVNPLVVTNLVVTTIS
jgi:hypothetical protein